jgi:quinol monooxygenase YgiN
MYIVTVTFVTRPDAFDGFLEKVQAQARNSFKLEPDCLQFDVCLPEETGHTVFLYEVYTDAAAFQAHLATAHFKTFNEATSDMVLSKDVVCMNRVGANS